MLRTATTKSFPRTQPGPFVSICISLPVAKRRGVRQCSGAFELPIALIAKSRVRVPHSSPNPFRVAWAVRSICILKFSFFNLHFPSSRDAIVFRQGDEHHPRRHIPARRLLLARRRPDLPGRFMDVRQWRRRPSSHTAIFLWQHPHWSGPRRRLHQWRYHLLCVRHRPVRIRLGSTDTKLTRRALRLECGTGHERSVTQFVRGSRINRRTIRQI